MLKNVFLTAQWTNFHISDQNSYLATRLGGIKEKLEKLPLSSVQKE